MADEETTEEVDRPETKAVPATERGVEWQEAAAVTGRPNDTPLRGEEEPAVPNSTMAERRAARTKAVAKAENKQVSDEDAEEKKPARKPPRKKAS